MDHKLTKVVFFGSGEFAIPTLKSLVEIGYEIPVVITTTESPVHSYVLDHNLPYVTSPNLNSPEFEKFMRNLDADIYVVASFKKIPKNIYTIPEYGAFNVHAALLPDYRGAAPITWAIANGESKTGITTFFLEETIDTGGIIEQAEVIIEKNDNYITLESRLAEVAVGVVQRTIEKIMTLEYKLIVQNSSPKLAPKLTMENRWLDCNKSVIEIINFVKAFPPKKPAYLALGYESEEDKNLYLFIHETKDYEVFSQCISPPGTLVSDSKRNFGVYGIDGIVWFNKVQRDGAKIISAQDFMNGQSAIATSFCAKTSKKKK